MNSIDMSRSYKTESIYLPLDTTTQTLHRNIHNRKLNKKLLSQIGKRGFGSRRSTKKRMKANVSEDSIFPIDTRVIHGRPGLVD